MKDWIKVHANISLLKEQIQHKCWTSDNFYFFFEEEEVEVNFYSAQFYSIWKTAELQSRDEKLSYC